MKKSSRITLLIIFALLILFTGVFTLYVASFSGFSNSSFFSFSRMLEMFGPVTFLVLALFIYIKLILIAKNPGQISREKEIRNYVMCFIFIFLAIFPVVALDFYRQVF